MINLRTDGAVLDVYQNDNEWYNLSFSWFINTYGLLSQYFEKMTIPQKMKIILQPSIHYLFDNFGNILCVNRTENARSTGLTTSMNIDIRNCYFANTPTDVLVFDINNFFPSDDMIINNSNFESDSYINITFGESNDTDRTTVTDTGNRIKTMNLISL